MFTIMMLLTGMLSSLSMQDYAPPQTAAAADRPAIYRTAYPAQPQVRTAVYPAPSGLEKLNGLTLQDRIEAADRLYGEPAERLPAYMSGEEYRYGGLNVGAYEEWIYYISVPASAKSFNLNGHELPMNRMQIRETLGTPDFTADDGFGYEHDGQALKVFVDPHTGEVTSIDLFDNTSV